MRVISSEFANGELTKTGLSILYTTQDKNYIFFLSSRPYQSYLYIVLLH